MEELEKKLRYNSIVINRECPFCIYPEAMLREFFELNCGEDILAHEKARKK